MARLATVQQMEPYIGKFYSMDWVKRNVLQQTQEEIEDMQAQMDSEEEYHMDFASRDGELAGATQAAQQNYLQANAPQALEAPTSDTQ